MLTLASRNAGQAARALARVDELHACMHACMNEREEWTENKWNLPCLLLCCGRAVYVFCGLCFDGFVRCAAIQDGGTKDDRCEMKKNWSDRTTEDGSVGHTGGKEDPVRSLNNDQSNTH